MDICTPDLDQESAPEGACLEDINGWGVCPYCRAYKHHDDHGGTLSLGNYVSGSGDVQTDDPMIFEDGSAENCGGKQRSSIAFWYCWYDSSTRQATIVALDFVEILWYEDVPCEYAAYVYTPLACDWALE